MQHHRTRTGFIQNPISLICKLGKTEGTIDVGTNSVAVLANYLLDQAQLLRSGHQGRIAARGRCVNGHCFFNEKGFRPGNTQDDRNKMVMGFARADQFNGNF